MESENVLEGLSYVTPALRALLLHFRSILSEPDCRGLVAHLVGLASSYTAELSTQAPGADRARVVHRLIDKEVAAMRGPAATCSSGCSACCHLEVEIAFDDAELLAERVRAGHPIDRDRLARQSARERKSALWASLVSAENRCVFLAEDGTCSVYPDRPSTCRKHFVCSPPAECSTVRGNPQPILVPQVEVLLSAALSLPDNPHASLPKSVHHALLRIG